MYLKRFSELLNRKGATALQGAKSVPSRLTLSFCGLLFFFSLHEFHASVTQMQYNAKEQVFEISIRVFTDDLERGLSAASGTKVNLANGTRHDALIEKYVRAHFTYANAQKQPKVVQYIGYETEADAQWIYLEMPYSGPFTGGTMRQNILTELFDDQVNMVNINYQNQKKTFVFRKNQAIQEVSL